MRISRIIILWTVFVILLIQFFIFPWYLESTLHLVLRLRGGGKKRKKKNYTTPKKIKHKHKKVKLAVLKYYRVDDNGKIHRLRRECPAEECGAGIFMAAHFDRQYCGKCGLTYMFNAMEEKWITSSNWRKINKDTIS